MSAFAPLVGLSGHRSASSIYEYTPLAAFAISFQKLVEIQEQVDIQKQIDIDVMVKGNSALADAKGESSALGPNTHTETLGLTTTVVQQGVGSSSSSIAESVAAATKAWDWHM